MRKRTTAIEMLKAQAPTLQHVNAAALLRGIAEDKGYTAYAFRLLAEHQVFGQLIQQLVLRSFSSAHLGLYNYLASAIAQFAPLSNGEIAQYRGFHDQNAQIDRAISTAFAERSAADFVGAGAATQFTPSGAVADLPNEVRNVPIVVIGYGAAGILIKHALLVMGFYNVIAYEKKRNTLGIWNYPNVKGGSRNNPRDLKFYNRGLNKAPGDASEITDFLENFEHGSDKRNVVSVTPGKFGHRLHFSEGDTKTAPIVINCMGLGDPKPLSDLYRMTTNATSRQAGPRWQAQLDDASQVKGKRFLFVGLGNSTAEMIRQLHEWQDKGVECDYRILTHYPESAIFEPDTTVEYAGRAYRVFRDLSKPNLVDYQGDLPHSRYDYYRAFRTGRIVAGVKRWSTDGSTALCFGEGNKLVDTFDYTTPYTLTGYRHTQESLERMGCAYDHESDCGLFDYDGELIANPRASLAGERLHKGLFAFGAALETRVNPNAIVIPGMLFRMGDLLFSIVMRAAEYVQENKY